MEQLLLELAPPPEPTLDNFHGGSNGPALAMLREALAGEPGQTERVFYLWGPPGSGKTHLCRATVGAARGQGWQAHCVDGTRLENLPDRTHGPDLQCLALDDIEKLDEAAQLIVFDTYNRLRAKRALILACGSLPPADLPLREDLRTRVASGVVMQLRPLTDMEKTDVLLDHARDRGMTLMPGIVEYLLAHFARDLGSLVAAVDALDRYSLRTRRPITLPLLRESLKLHGSPS